MGKRSVFERRVKDFYPTPEAGVLPLLDHLMIGTRFYEPCAGDGQLIDHLERFGHICVGASDIEDHGYHPKVRAGVDCRRLLDVDADIFITNPPWNRPDLHSIIDHLVHLQRQAWLLIDADWAHTKQSASYMRLCASVVSIGRLRWIADSPHTGKDNCCWYLFSPWHEGPSQFYGRV